MTDLRTQLHRQPDGSIDIVVSDAIDARSAAIVALVSEVNKGNKVTIHTANATLATERLQVSDAANNSAHYRANAPSWRPASERLDDSTPLSKVATRLGAGVACGALSLILAPGSLWLTALSALAGMLIIHAIAIRYDHR